MLVKLMLHFMLMAFVYNVAIKIAKLNSFVCTNSGVRALRAIFPVYFIRYNFCKSHSKVNTLINVAYICQSVQSLCAEHAQKVL